MTDTEFFAELERLGIHLWLEGQTLHYDAPRGSLNSGLRAELARRKDALCQLLRQAGASSPMEPSTAPENRTGILPLSYAQQRLWSLNQSDPHSPVYNIPIAFSIEGRFNSAVLDQALSEIVRRHESLRVTLADADGRPFAIVHPPQPLRVPLVDLGLLSAAETQRWVELEAERPFDLSRGPLFRTVLLHLRSCEHVLLITMHHTVSDEWSVRILLQEMARITESLGAGRPSELADLAMQYSDYVRWQRAWLREVAARDMTERWKSRLSNLPVLNLPTDRPRPAVLGCAGASITFRLPSDLTKAIADLGRRYRTTTFMTMLAAYCCLLRWYSGQTDVVLGTAVASRDVAEFQDIIGMFVNTVVLRVDLSGALTFQEVLAQVRSVVLDAHRDGAVPFDVVVDQAQPQRSTSYSPLYQTFFNIMDKWPTGPTFSGVQLAPIDIGTRTSKFDLSLDLAWSDSTLVGTLTYNPELFDTETVLGMADDLRLLLQWSTQNPEEPLEWAAIAASQRTDKTADAYTDRTPADVDVPVHRIFERIVELYPNRTAVVLEKEHLTYSELNARANKLSRYLNSLGVGCGALVGVYMDRSCSMIVSLLAILKSGAGYVPVDPDQPSKRVKQILSESTAQIVLVDSPLRKHELEGATIPVWINDEWPRISGLSDSNRVFPTCLDAPAYVLYTSGSTGIPKGAIIPHRGLSNYMAWLLSSLKITGEDRTLQKTSCSFDASVLEIMASLLSGGTLVMARPGGQHDPVHLLDILARERITLLQLVPSLLDVLLEEGLANTQHCLRSVISAGEVLQPRLQARFFAGLQAELYNIYGPTETSINVTCWRCQRDSRLSSVPLGEVITNACVHVLDSAMQSLPRLAVGEAYIGGRPLGTGYVGQPAQTADRFLPNPFSGPAGSRLYRSGDLVRDRYGVLEFLGRADQQIKIHGCRVEPGEVESTLKQHPSVRECTVLGRISDTGKQLLAAYVVPRSKPWPSVGEIRAFLTGKLPNYMIPSEIEFLECMPRLTSGKTDLHALQAVRNQTSTARTFFVPPTGPIEQALAAIWAQTLDLPRVSAQDNFFELGGDSLLSLHVIAKACKAGIRITPRMVLENDTLADLARAAAVLGSAVCDVENADTSVSLTPIQHWLFEHNLPDIENYNIAGIIQVPGFITVPLLHQAIPHLTGHHDVFCLRFRKGLSEWQQFRQEGALQPPCGHVDLSALSSRVQTAMRKRLAAEVRKRLNIQNGPMMRLCVFTTGTGAPAAVLFVIHHLICDGISMDLLVDDLETICRHLGNGQPVCLPRKTTTFRAWAERLNDMAQSPSLAEQARAWQNLPWHNWAPLPLEAAAPVPPNDYRSSQLLSVTLEKTETAALVRQFLTAMSGGMDALILTSLMTAFHAWTGRRWLLVDMTLHGREAISKDIDLSRTVGYITFDCPALLHLPAENGPPAVMRVHQQLQYAIQNGLTYNLLRYLNPDPQVQNTMRALPQPEIKFNYHGITHGSGLTLFLDMHEPVRGVLGPDDLRSYLFNVNAAIFDDRLRIDLKYNARLHKPTTVQRLADDMVACLRSLSKGSQ